MRKETSSYDGFEHVFHSFWQRLLDDKTMFSERKPAVAMVTNMFLIVFGSFYWTSALFLRRESSSCDGIEHVFTVLEQLLLDESTIF